MTGEARLRAGELGDAQCIGALAIQVFLDTYATEGIRPDLAREALEHYGPAAFAQRLADPGRSFTLVERDGHLLAFAEVVVDAPSAELVRLYVQPAFQGKRLGRALIAHTEAACRAGGVDRLWLTAWEGNARALGFYRRQGFTTEGTAEHVIEGRSYRNHVLAKTLKAPR